MNRKILCGDVLEKLKEIPDEYVDCIISSPPYWGLRDYGTGIWVGGDSNCTHDSIRHKTRAERGGLSDFQKANMGSFGDEKKWKSDICPDCNAQYVDNQMGLESDFKEYLDKLSKIMDELKRVLKPTGSCWINLGDTYSTISGGMRDINKGDKKQYGKIAYNQNAYSVDQTKFYSGLKSKSRVGIPERFYINCIDSGWIARNHIPWYKANSMPSSVKDRFTNKWESIFFFVKNKKYYFDLDAVRVPLVSGPLKKPKVKKTERKWKTVSGQTTQGIHRNRSKGESDWKEYLENDASKYTEDKQSNGQRLGKFRNNERWQSGWDENNNCRGCGQPKSKHHSAHNKNINNGDTAEFTPCNPRGKNPGDVFFINPRPFPKAHFATFPVDLPLKILKCSCPKQVCSNCGMIREPIKKTVGNTITENMKIAGCNKEGKYFGESQKDYENNMAQNASNSKKSILDSMGKIEKITGYTKCDCNESFKPGIVLDPFFGAGTVGIAAEELGLDWMGIELNPDYIKIANERLEPLLAQKKLFNF